MARRKVTPEEMESALKDLPGWLVVDRKLYKKFQFNSFAQAIAWIVSVAIYADKIDHHPEWANVYNRVEVHLITHDMDAISTLDLELATHMNSLAD